MEIEIEDSNEMYNLITENTSDFIAVINRSGDFKYVSPSFSRKLGYNLVELSTSNFISIVFEEDRELVIEKLNIADTDGRLTGVS